MSNANLRNAQISQRDEFYITYQDVQEELQHYSKHFKGKTILCNCDDPRISNFAKYFIDNFNQLGLKRLICTGYNKLAIMPQMSIWELLGGNPERGYLLDITKVPVSIDDYQQLTYNGDFRTKECEQYLDECDIVVTGPPFSLFREYLKLLMKHHKQFLIVGNVNAITYREFFPLLKDNKVWLGASIHSGDRKFYVPKSYPLEAAGCGIDEEGHRFIRVKGVRWYTNLDYAQRHTDLVLHKTYTPEDYPKYDNYDAINVDNTSDIPKNYWGVMGVPITFLDKYNPSQFEIVKFRKGDNNKDLSIKGECPYFRILIRRLR